VTRFLSLLDPFPPPVTSRSKVRDPSPLLRSRSTKSKLLFDLKMILKVRIMKRAFYMDSIAKKKLIFLDIVIYCFLEFGNGDSRVGVECTARPKKR